MSLQVCHKITKELTDHSMLHAHLAQDCAEEDSEAALKQPLFEWITVEKQDDPESSSL